MPILVLSGVLALGVSPDARQALRRGAPETFSANAQVKGPGGAAAATTQIHIERFTPDFDRKSVETALKAGGYPAFLGAMRKAPDVGYVSVGSSKQTIRWARERATEKGR